MSAAATTQFSEAAIAGPHPNEVDCKRIERALGGRERYRYVAPSVHPVHNGYQVASPCCSRNIDKDGGVIDIARLEYLPDQGSWRLYHKDHGADQWECYAALDSLMDVLEVLKCDPLRVFWP